MIEDRLKKRDGGLAFWLKIILLGNTIFIASQVWAGVQLLFFPFGAIFFTFFNAFFFGSPPWLMPLFVTYSIISIGSVVTLFKWRKWGFYAICLTTIVGFVTGITSGVLTFGILVNCFGTIILAILLRTEWSQFR
jgi:hypothetical protein